jgi:FAD/FMN-containing dehydrogenase
MSARRRKLSDDFWLSLASTFGHRKVLKDKAAAGAVPLHPEPLAAFFPEDPSEVSILLQTARAEKVKVVSCGACSRAHAAMQKRLPAEGYVAIGLQNLAGVEEVQSDSLWMSVRAGTPLDAVRRSAEEHGLQLPEMSGAADGGTVGGWLSVYGSVDGAILSTDQPAVLSVEAVLPTGNLVRSVPVPRAATGPDLFSVFLGTWGGFGIITRATLKLQPLSERRALAGFHFSSTGRALEVMRSVTGRIWPPRAARMIIEGEAGRRKARLAMSFEGEQSLAEVAGKYFRAEARRAGGTAAGTDEVRSWLSEQPAQGRSCHGGFVRWSEVSGLQRKLEARLGRVERLLLDRPGLTGCRLQVVLGEGQEGKPEEFQNLLDPQGSAGAAVDSARDFLTRVRDRLDPDGLVNPHAWPLPAPGGGL